ncbi:hypothetical protein [Bacteroides oleiciplenus]|uniref:hypothetical protein n=1 Tax=Bacteroides oleiciplenus TaxID=626931 RepID=UPI0026DBD095|nr:hypothetical protein [Bacteroides oleiciplenus]
MKKILLVWICFIYGLFFSCTQEIASDIFDRVERYMEICPDSALLLLNRIQHPEKLSGKQRADYALLLTQARDKNYLDSLQSDSLIELAVDFYRNSDDRIRAGKALFYYGKVAALQKDEEVAMKSFLGAQEKLEHTNEYRLKALIQEYVGYLNEDRNMYDMALENYRRSVDYYKKVGDSLGIAYIYRNLAWIYERKNNNDSVTWYVTEAISLLRGDSTSPVFPSLMQLCGVIESNQKNYLEAANYYLIAIKHERIGDLSAYYKLSLGDTYMTLEQLDKAEECFNSILLSKDTFALSTTYNCLYRLEKLNARYEKALYYKEASDSLLQIAQKEDLRGEILKLQQKYETEKLQLEKKLLRQEMLIQLLGGVALFIILAWSGIFFYRKMKMRYRNAYEKCMQDYSRKNKEIINANEQLIGQYICQIEELKQKKIEAADSFKEQIEKLEQEMQFLIDKNREIRENSYADGISVLRQLKGGLLIVENMTSAEKMQLFGYIDSLFGSFVTRLCEEYALKEANLLLAIFIKLGFSLEELVIVFDSEPEAVRKRKQRLKSKIGLDSKTNLDVFLAIYPRKMSC